MLTSVAIVLPAPARPPPRTPGARRRSAAELRQDGLDDLLAVDDLGHEALAVDVAVLVVGRLHQDARLLVGGNGHAVQRLGELLRIDLSHLLGHGLADADGELSIDALI